MLVLVAKPDPEKRIKELETEVAHLREELSNLVALKDRLVIQNRENWEQQDAWRNRCLESQEALRNCAIAASGGRVEQIAWIVESAIVKGRPQTDDEKAVTHEFVQKQMGCVGSDTPHPKLTGAK